MVHEDALPEHKGWSKLDLRTEYRVDSEIYAWSILLSCLYRPIDYII